MTPRGPRPVPADMLLIAERRRRMAGSAPPGPEAVEEDLVAEEILIPDEDQLIETEAAVEPSPARSAAQELVLHRPMAYVSLTQMSWSGPIDHPALQTALRCYPLRAREGAARLLAFEPPPFPAGVVAGAALELTLRAGDVAMLPTIVAPGARAEASQLFSAVCVPEKLTGAEPNTVHAVSPVLAAYRRASLAHAWHAYVNSFENAQLHRERDEAAVAVLSTLRALLGER